MSTTTRQILISCGVVVAAFVALAVIGRSAYKSGQEMAQHQKQAKSTPNETIITPEIKKQNWEYEEEIDTMTDKKTRRASTLSINTINLKFPYEGEQKARLVVRKHPRYGKDILIVFREGQVDMDMDGGNVLIRFDNEKPQTVYFLGPADNSRNTIFLRGFDRLYSKIKNAKSLSVEVVFYSNGVKQLNFDISNFPTKEFETNG